MTEDMRVPGFHFIISLNQIISLARLTYAAARHHGEDRLGEQQQSLAGSHHISGTVLASLRRPR